MIRMVGIIATLFTGNVFAASDTNFTTTVSIENDTPYIAAPTPSDEILLAEDDSVGLGLVIGADGRKEVTNQSGFPVRTIGRLRNNGGSVCTGTLVGPRHVLTAAHCVWDGRQWMTDGLLFSPAYRRNSAPYGSINWKRVETVSGYTRDGLQEWDFALVVLSEDIGNRTGWMAYGYDNNLAPGWILNVIGYPVDRETGEAAYFSNDKIIEAQNQLLVHSADTFGGMSGSALYVYKPADQSRVIYGIHTGVWNNGSSNRGVRINKTVFDKLQEWQTANP